MYYLVGSSLSQDCWLVSCQICCHTCTAKYEDRSFLPFSQHRFSIFSVREARTSMTRSRELLFGSDPLGGSFHLAGDLYRYVALIIGLVWGKRCRYFMGKTGFAVDVPQIIIPFIELHELNLSTWCVTQYILASYYPVLLSLGWFTGNFTRTPLYFMGKTMVSWFLVDESVNQSTDSAVFSALHHRPSAKSSDLAGAAAAQQ